MSDAGSVESAILETWCQTARRYKHTHVLVCLLFVCLTWAMQVADLQKDMLWGDDFKSSPQTNCGNHNVFFLWWEQNDWREPICNLNNDDAIWITRNCLFSNNHLTLLQMRNNLCFLNNMLEMSCRAILSVLELLCQLDFSVTFLWSIWWEFARQKTNLSVFDFLHRSVSPTLSCS